MSDDIPFHVQAEIIKRLPVKSIVQFRSVSKTWKSFIDSSEFIADHSLHHAHSHRLLVGYQRFDPNSRFPQQNYVSIVDDETFPQQNHVSIVDDETFPQQRSDPTVPLLDDRFKESKIIGSSHGLLCLYGYDPEYSDSPSTYGKAMAVVWNPSIRKSVAISVPHVLPDSYNTVLRFGLPDKYNTVVGFGVCPGTSDFKLVKMICMCSETEIKTSIPWQVEVFTLSSWTWRNQLINLPRKSVMFTWCQTVLDGFIYFLATETINENGGYCYDDLIMSFDLSNDEFREIDLPVSLAQNQGTSLSISKLRESLAVLEECICNGISTYGVWVMEHGVPNSFTKLFTIKAPGFSRMKFMEFRKSGEAIIRMQEKPGYYSQPVTLAIFEPYSGSFNDLEISGEHVSFRVNSYMETLLLLNHKDGTSYFDQD